MAHARMMGENEKIKTWRRCVNSEEIVGVNPARFHVAPSKEKERYESNREVPLSDPAYADEIRRLFASVKGEVVNFWNGLGFQRQYHI